ncbi:MAG TPA: D-alanyl-D-alanine carboxypeptidase, partial [Chitinophaga sp.]
MNKKVTQSLFLSILLLSGTALQAQQAGVRKLGLQLVNNPVLRQAHVGVCIYDPEKQTYWYEYQDDRYFTPASNTKIFTLYTGLQMLGDSLPAMKYLETDSVLYIKGTGDPSFLHPDFVTQPAMQLLTQTN